MILLTRIHLLLIPFLLLGADFAWAEKRTWTMTNGRRALAELTFAEGSFIFLRFGPLERRFELNEFSQVDREYVRKWVGKERCAACNLPLTTRIKKTANKTYHLSCFHCLACGKSFKGGDRFILGQWGNLVHSQHQSQTFQCGSCRRFFPRRGASTKQQFSDGRVVCRVCLQDAVFDKETLSELHTELSAMMKDKGIASPEGKVEFKLVSKRELNNQAKRIHVGGNLKGLTVSRFRKESSKGETTVTFSHIVYVLFGMPKAELRSVISHELMHVWLNERGVEGPADVIEGFCNLGSDHVLRQDPSRLAVHLMENMKTDKSPVYGTGYRKMIARLKQIGWARMLNEMQARGKKF